MGKLPDIKDTTIAYYEANARPYFTSTVGINMTVLYVPFLTYMRSCAAILDAGCGSGRDALYFAKKGYRVTAIDNSPTLVKMAAKLTGLKILELAFQDLRFEAAFHGVWACSSLLHVPMDGMHDVLARLSRSMKVDGVMYASFKYGAGEHYRDARFFLDLDEAGFDRLVGKHPELTVLRYWRTADLKSGNEGQTWLNVLVRKTGPTRKMTFLGVGRMPSD